MKTLWKRFTCWFFGVHSCERVGRDSDGKSLYECSDCGKKIELIF